MSDNKFNQDPAKLVKKYDRRARLAAWASGMALGFLTLSEQPAQAESNSRSQRASAELVAGKNEQASLTPEALIGSINTTMQKLTGEVKALYAKGSHNVKMTPYKETLLNGTPIQLDYYVLSVPKGAMDGQKIYDKFVVASADGGDEVAPSIYQVALGAADTNVNPAFDPFRLATKFMQMGAADASKTTYGLNITSGSNKTKFDVYGVSETAGVSLISTDLSKHTQTTASISIQEAAAAYKSFEASAEKILGEVSQ